MNRALENKIAVVTGGSGAIGSAIIAGLEQQGACAVSLDVAPPAAGSAPFQVCDVRDDASVASAIAKVQQTYGRLDLVVHAAGVSREAVVWKLAVEDWDFVQSVNLRGAFLLLRHAIPVMRAGEASPEPSRRGGRIVLIGSINGSRGKFGTSAYSASKAGLIALSRTVAREVARLGILINVVEPGWVRTPLTDSLPQAVRDAALAESLVGKYVEPADVAAAVTFLCGPGAQQITGQILRVDGGQSLGSV
jgi:3-oxoacyl-[acyl-carrier protein] reductase